MDVNDFRLPQSPFFFTQPPQILIEAKAKSVAIPKKSMEPTPDSRFPGWAAPMNDGRLVTDYRTHCAVNIPTGTQFATRGWMQRNADELIKTSRARQAEHAGAGMSYDGSTELPANAFVKCDPTGCGYVPNVEAGLGVERKEVAAPLFGTFAPSYPSWSKPAAPSLTKVYEGGRNTPRGSF
jgi:hypothetical protein